MNYLSKQPWKMHWRSRERERGKENVDKGVFALGYQCWKTCWPKESERNWKSGGRNSCRHFIAQLGWSKKNTSIRRSVRDSATEVILYISRRKFEKYQAERKPKKDTENGWMQRVRRIVHSETDWSRKRSSFLAFAVTARSILGQTSCFRNDFPSRNSCGRAKNSPTRWIARPRKWTKHLEKKIERVNWFKT